MFIIAEPGLLGEGEGAGVERVGELLVVLGDHPGAAAVGAVEGDQLDPEPLGDQRHRAVQLGGEAARDAAGPVGELHSFSFGPVDDFGLAELLLVGLGLDVLLAADVEVELGPVLLGVLVDALDLLLRVAGELVVHAGDQLRQRAHLAGADAADRGRDRAEQALDRADGLGISLPLIAGAYDSCSSSDSSRVPFFLMIFTNAASWLWPLLRSLISSSWPAARRRRMIWSIGATPLGQASTQAEAVGAVVDPVRVLGQVVEPLAASRRRGGRRRSGRPWRAPPGR